MNLIEKNPFRVLGVISNASAKEILESQTFLERYLEVDKSADLGKDEWFVIEADEYDSAFLTKEQSVCI